MLIAAAGMTTASAQSYPPGYGNPNIPPSGNGDPWESVTMVSPTIYRACDASACFTYENFGSLDDPSWVITNVTTKPFPGGQQVN